MEPENIQIIKQFINKNNDELTDDWLRYKKRKQNAEHAKPLYDYMTIIKKEPSHFEKSVELGFGFAAGVFSFGVIAGSMLLGVYFFIKFLKLIGPELTLMLFILVMIGYVVNGFYRGWFDE